MSYAVKAGLISQWDQETESNLIPLRRMEYDLSLELGERVAMDMVRESLDAGLYIELRSWQARDRARRNNGQD